MRGEFPALGYYYCCYYCYHHYYSLVLNIQKYSEDRLKHSKPDIRYILGIHRKEFSHKLFDQMVAKWVRVVKILPIS